MRCKIHPQYKALRRPTSKKKRCTCMQLYMMKYEPDYKKCDDKRKEVYWGICKHSKKDTIVICNFNNKPCIAWEGYKHD